MFFLDTDPGQPEFTAPGFISLWEIEEESFVSDNALGGLLIRNNDMNNRILEQRCYNDISFNSYVMVRLDIY